MKKDSTKYFMTKMKQQEFSERSKGHQIKKYEFNRIQPERLSEKTSKEDAIV